MTNLHFDITGDCTGALTALSNTESAVDHLSGRNAAFGIEATGADRAIRQLSSVSAARDAVTGLSTVDVQARGIGAVSSDLRGLRGEVASTAGGMRALSGMDVGGGGSVRQLVSDLGGARQAFQGIMGDAEPALAMVGARTSQADQAMQALGGSTNSATTSLGEFGGVSRDLASSNEAVGSSGLYSADSISRVGGSAKAAGSDFRGMSSDVKGASSALKSSVGDFSAWEGELSGGGGSIRKAFTQGIVEGLKDAGDRLPGIRQALIEGMAEGLSDTGGPGGPPRGPGGGGGGGGGGRGGGRGRGGAGGLGDEGDGFGGLGSMHGLAQPLMMGALLGGAESLLTGAGGLMAVNEAIKQTPALAYAANGAMGQFDKGIRQAASSAIADGVPALHSLGRELHGLGTEVGAVGAEHMGTALAGATDLAGNATTALKHLDPAIESSIKGLVGLGDAVMGGISNPATVTAIKGVGDALANPQNEAGIESLVSGLGSVSAMAATVTANVAGVVGNLTGMGGGAAAGPVTGAGLGAFLGKSAFGGLGGGLLGAGLLGEATREQQAGQDPTAGLLGGVGAGLLAKSMGAGGLPLALAGAAGDLMGHQVQATQGGAFTHAADDQSGVPNSPLHGPTGSGSWRDSTWLGKAYGTVANALSGPPKSPTGGAAAASPFPAGQSAPHGWDRDAQGNLTPSAAPTALSKALAGHQQALATLNRPMGGGAAAVARAEPGGSTLGLPQGIIPRGPGSSVGVAPASLQQLNQGFTQAATGAQTLQQRTSTLVPPMQSLQQNTSQATSSAQQMGQSYTQATQQVQHMSQTVAPTMSSLGQMHSQVSSSLSQAQSSLVSGGNQMGSQLPQSMSAGISSGQSSVCDASAQMSQGAADCASSALGIQSPSKEFQYIGSMTGAGMALGIQGSTGLAAGAAGTAMMNVSDVASNYAKDAGLNLGTLMGTNIASGLNTSIQQNLLKATGLAQGVDSPLAKLVLGQMGALGMAGSGAQSWDLTSTQPGIISFSGGVPANSAPPTIPTPQVHVYIGNNALDPHLQQVVTKNFNELAVALAGARR